MLHSLLPLGPKADQLFSYIGSLALVENNQEAAQLCRELVHEIGSSEVDVRCSVVHALCEACDFFRSKQRPDIAAKLELLIASLKGKQQRVIVGGLQFGMESLSQIDDVLEDLRSTILVGAK